MVTLIMAAVVCSEALKGPMGALNFGITSYKGTLHWSPQQTSHNTMTTSSSDRLFLSSYDPFQLDPEDVKVHILLAKFSQPPPYRQFDVVFSSNPLIPLLQRMPDYEIYSTYGNMVCSSDTVITELVKGKLSLGSFTSPDLEVIKSIAVKSVASNGRKNVNDENVR